jgi:hypothetical protein
MLEREREREREREKGGREERKEGRKGWLGDGGY